MPSLWEKIEDILPDVEKPVRYINREVNAAKKSWNRADIKVCLVYPDTYEIGMSNLGLQILYALLNSKKGIIAERVYNPWIDFERQLLNHKIPLFSLETNHPVKDFDILGITLQHELTYTNILRLLDLARIPLLADERGGEYPLVVGGGPAAYNPEPLSPFFDCFVIGDGEEVIFELVDMIRNFKNNTQNKKELLKELANIKGVYVPSLYKTIYDEEDRILRIKNSSHAPPVIEKRLINDINYQIPYDNVIVPYMDIVHERVNAEIMRGCTRGCRFCQAGIIYRPVREKKCKVAQEEIRELFAVTGQDQIGLSALSCSDYTRIEELVNCLVNDFRGQGISISLPSLRVDTFSVKLASEIQKIRKTGLTFAPEAGSQRLRNVINKQISQENILKAAEAAFYSGWFKLKLYFMIGLPTEKHQDIQAMADLIDDIVLLGRRTISKSVRKRIKINVSISNFIPKPHTPFQWLPMDKDESLKEKQDYLKARIVQREVNLKWHDIKQSRIEAIFSRGDRRLSAVLQSSIRKGCRFDNWSEFFDNNLWEKSFSDSNINPDFYLYRNIGHKEVLPWDHIDTLVKKEFLLRELSMARQGRTSDDCRFRNCLDCGLCKGPVKNVLDKIND